MMVRGSKSEIREEYKGDFSFREIHQWVPRPRARGLRPDLGKATTSLPCRGWKRRRATKSPPFMVRTNVKR